MDENDPKFSIRKGISTLFPGATCSEEDADLYAECLEEANQILNWDELLKEAEKIAAERGITRLEAKNQMRREGRLPNRGEVFAACLQRRRVARSGGLN